MLHNAVLTNPIRLSDRVYCRTQIRFRLDGFSQNFGYWQSAEVSFADIAQAVHVGLDLLRHKLRCSSSILEDTRENLTRGGDIPLWQPCSESIAGDFARSISEFLATIAIDLEFMPLLLYVQNIQDVTKSSLKQYLETDLEVLQMPVRAMSDALFDNLTSDAIDTLQAQWREFTSEVQFTLDNIENARPAREPKTMYSLDVRGACEEEFKATAATLTTLNSRLKQLQSSTDGSPILEARLQQRIAELEETLSHCRERVAQLDVVEAPVSLPPSDRSVLAATDRLSAQECPVSPATVGQILPFARPSST